MNQNSRVIQNHRNTHQNLALTVQDPFLSLVISKKTKIGYDHIKQRLDNREKYSS